MFMKNKRQHVTEQGFTLLEVLITVLIVGFGLLGIAGIMVVGITANNVSFVRSVAVQQAYDMADRIRANSPAGFVGTSYDAITYTASQSCTACTSASMCTPTAMAAYDACYWNTQNETLIPLGRGTVTRTGSEFLVAVSWDDSKSGSPNKSFALRVQP